MLAPARRGPSSKPEGDSSISIRLWRTRANPICQVLVWVPQNGKFFVGFCGRIPVCRSRGISFILNGKINAGASTGGHADNGNGSLAPPVPLDGGMSKNEGWANTKADEKPTNPSWLSRDRGTQPIAHCPLFLVSYKPRRPRMSGSPKSCDSHLRAMCVRAIVVLLWLCLCQPSTENT